MYILLLIIHLVFIFVAYILGFPFLSFIFWILWVGFSFYFSSFLGKYISLPSIPSSKMGFDFSFESFSRQGFFPIAILLFYISIYGIAYGLIGYDEIDERIFQLHNIIILSLFLVLFSLFLVFERKLSELFYRITRFHGIFSWISSIILSGIYFTDNASLSSIYFINVCILIGLMFFIEYKDRFVTDGERKQYFIIFLFLITSSIVLFGYNLFSFDKILWLIFVLSIMSILIFDYIPKITTFRNYGVISKYFWLLSSFLSVLLLYYYSFEYFSFSIALLAMFTIFHIGVHFRYGNYLAFLMGIVSIYFIYTKSFFPMILGTWNEATGFFSAVMFLYFLPIGMIGSTFFWKQEYEYDYAFIHYFSIIFSIVFSLYHTWVAGFNMLEVSLLLFFLSLLFFFSYIRLKQ